MNLPTKITISRIIAIVVMMVTLFVLQVLGSCGVLTNIPCINGTKVIGSEYTGINWLYFGLFFFFVLASFTDFLDGYLARKNNQVTTLGKFLDPVADKLLVNSMVIFLVIRPIFAPEQMQYPIFDAILLVARDIVVDALRFIGAQKGVVIAANKFGKAKTVLEMVAISLVLLNGWPFSYFDYNWGLDNNPGCFQITKIVIYLATLTSVISGIIYVVQNRKVLKDTEKYD